jgi:hypothetical protein
MTTPLLDCFRTRGAFLVEFARPIGPATSDTILRLNSSGATLVNNLSGGQIQTSDNNGNSVNVPITWPGARKYLFTHDSGLSNQWVNGVKYNANNPFTPNYGAPTFLQIASSLNVPASIKRIRVYDTPLTDTEAQGLST